jgi:hypothetical protein
MKKFGALGWIGLLIAMAIALTLAAKQWNALGPTAAELSPNATARDASGNALGPGVAEMRSITDDHAKAVQETLQSVD